MQQQHNTKKISTKPSLKNIKPNKKSLKNTSSLITSARTPRSGQFLIDLKKSPLQQFKTMKSIPTITYREVQSTLYPSEAVQNQENLSYLNFNHTQYRQQSSQIQSIKAVKIKRLLSDRRIEKSCSSGKQKNSPFIKIKIKNDQKTKKKKQTNINTKKNSKQRRNTTLNIGHFSPQNSKIQSKNKLGLQRLLRRTNQVLIRYKTRQQLWKKQKQSLLKQLQKYKKKANGKSITTTSSSHNIMHSHKLLM